MLKIILYGLGCLTLLISVAQKDEKLINMNADWWYSEAEPGELPKPTQKWEPISLPHSWNALDATDNIPGYRRAASWYKRVLDISPDPDKRYFLYFEGVNITSKIYINNQLTGKHVGGYVGFEIEITAHLKASSNEILVWVSNGYNPEVIPSSKSDFFIFGGITRDVWLKSVSDQTHILSLEITTPQVSDKRAKTTISCNLDGSNYLGKSLRIEVYNPQNQRVFSQDVIIKNQTEQLSFNLKKPDLWHVNHPDLYTVRATIMDKDGNLDELSERYGYRWFEFKEHGAFYLNGERLKLRGTHRHEEFAGYGAAMPNDLHRQDMQMIKEMGANMVRLAHYPQDPEVYKACDELGIIVWDELPWCRGGLGNDQWKSNTKRLLEEMIKQNRNHPSIVFWSLGNEIYWLPDFENGDDREKINVFLQELNELAHKLDPYRLTAIRKYYEGSHIPDVFSPSIWSGWYSGKYTDYKASIDAALSKYNRFLHAEYGGSSHVGRHNEQIKSLDSQIESTLGNEAIVQVGQMNYARDGDWSENYMVDLMDWHLMVSETTDEFAGNLQWAFKDFGTPLRPENAIPYINQKGLVDREGNPKDVYYVFKSYWAEEPFTYIESATWTERYGEPEERKSISVYSNCAQVELFLNGESIGMKNRMLGQFPANGLSWEVQLQKGENQLVAVGSTKQEPVYDSLNVTYYHTPPGPPVKLNLTHTAQSDGTILITATAVDENGRLSTTYQNKVYFQSLSGGSLKAHFGTPTGSSVIDMANGKASIIFYPDHRYPKASVTVLNQDFKGTYLEIPLQTTSHQH